MQAERVVLAGLMVADPATTYAVDNLPAEAFADPLHQHLFWHLLIGAEAAAATDDAGDLDYAAKLVAAVLPRSAPEDAILTACKLIRRSWIERCQFDAASLAPVPANLVELASWAPRGVA